MARKRRRLTGTAVVSAAAIAALAGAAPAAADEVIICPDCVIEPGNTVPGSAGREHALVKIEGLLDKASPKLHKIEGVFHKIDLKLGAIFHK